MDISKIFEGKEITENSKKLYLKNLIRLNDGAEIKNLNFLKNPEEITKKLEKYKPNTQRTYIISIVSLLKSVIASDPKYKKLYEKYSGIMDTYNKQLKENTEPTEKEKENWISKEDLDKKREELLKHVEEFGKKKLTEIQFQELQKLLLIALYTIQRPRRNVDYQVCIVMKKEEPDLPTDKNYLFLDTNKFLFNNYKTKGKYLSQTEDVKPEMRKILDLYLKLFPLAKSLKSKIIEQVPLIVNFKGETYPNNNDMTRLLYKIFDDKKVGCSQFRKMFLTEKYGDILKELKNDTEAMGTSTNMAETQYIKNMETK